MKPSKKPLSLSENASASPWNITELLLQTIDSPALGAGGAHFCYRFSTRIPGLESYILRVRKALIEDGTFKQQLEALLHGSTSLTPPSFKAVPRLLSGMHVGQALMRLDDSDDVSIVLQQPGTSFADLIEAPAADGECRDGKVRLFETLVALRGKTDINPFVHLFEQAYRLSRAGLIVDFDIHNVFLNPQTQTLELIDQHRPKFSPDAYLTSDPRFFKNEIDQLLEDFHPDTKELSEGYRAGYTAYKAMVRAAAAQVIQHPPVLDATPFADVSDVQAVALSKAPYVLVKRLQELEARARIPGIGG